MTELHQHLSDLAEEVVAVDLRDRVRTASRRATTRRRILTVSASAAAVVAIAAGVAWAGLPRAAAPQPVMPVTSASPTSTSPTSTSPTPASPTKESAPSTPVEKMPEQYFYLRDDSRLIGVPGGTKFTAPADTCGLSLSPDHTKVAYVTNGDGDFRGDLIVADLSGGTKVAAATDVLCSGGNHPQWLGPEQLLIYHSDDFPGGRTLVDVRTGKSISTPLNKVEDYVAMSPNREFVAHRSGTNAITIRSDGGRTKVHVRAIGDVMDNGNGFAVLAVSDDGRRVAVGAMNTDPGVARTGSIVIDIGSGRPIPLPGKDYEREVLLLPGSNMVVRVKNVVYLVDRNGKELDRGTVPASARTAELIAAS